MEEQGRMGRWAKLFGGSLRFELEAARAKEIGAVWTPSKDGDEVDIVFDLIDGYATPAWGSDSAYLYVRRPEGAWKTKLRTDLVDRIGLIHQRFKDGTESDNVLLGRGFSGRGGWIYSAMEPATAGEIDALFTLEGLAGKVEADEEANALWKFVERSAQRDVVSAGCSFGSDRLEFSQVGECLIATDMDTKWRVVYDMSKNTEVRMSMEAGRLWLRFEGRWMKPVDVKVSLVSLAG
jgi:hypothetical protein